MNESVFLAVFFAILAFSGLEKGPVPVGKLCRMDVLAQIWPEC